MSGRPAPPKPWERKGPATTSTTTPLGPSTANDGAPKPWETTTPSSAAPATSNALVSRTRPWEAPGGSQYGTSTSYGGLGSSPYGIYGSGSMYSGNYGSMPGGYGSSTYAGGMGGYGSTYGAGSYGGSMYGRPMGSMGSYGGYGSGIGSYGSSYGGGGSMFGRPYGGYNSYGAGIGGGYMGATYGQGALPGPPGAPFDPANPPPPPPTAWQSMLHAIGGIVHFFGRLSFLVDENAHAVHFFIAALLQLLDRAGSLYGELARFVLRLLGYKGKPQTQAVPGGLSPMTPGGPPQALPPQEGPGFDSVWGN